jgi:drug/metabolite transporter (DMT)-like permease
MPFKLPAPAPVDNMKGILWMLLFTLAMGTMHGCIRHVSAGLHPFEIAFFRNLFGLIVVVPWIIRLGLAPLRTARLGLLTLRGVINVISMLAFFTALTIAPLAEVTALSFSAPIFATLLAMIVFGERAGIRRWTAIVVGFLGTLVILRPGYAEVGLGAMLTVFAALLWGVCMVIIKSLGRTESAVTITIYMSLVMAPLSLIAALFVWQWPTWEELAWLVGIGILGGTGQLAMAEALRVAETHVIMPVDFMKLIWVAAIAYLWFAEVPDAFALVGGVMIFGSTAFIAWREHVMRAAPKPPAEPT